MMDKLIFELSWEDMIHPLMSKFHLMLSLLDKAIERFTIKANQPDGDIFATWLELFIEARYDFIPYF